MAERMVARTPIIAKIEAERERQDAKWGWTENPASVLPGWDPHRKMTVVLEEVGEVAMALNDQDWTNLEVELVQVAACCIAWLEARAEGRP